MPYNHILLLKFKPSVSQTEIDGIFAAIHKIADQKLVPGYLSVSGGPYESPEGMNKGFTHGLTIVFADKESRDGYLPHPQHDVIRNLLIPAIEDILVFDYVI